MRIIQDLAEALSMAGELPFFVALPISGSAYALFVWSVAKAIKAVREAFK